MPFGKHRGLLLSELPESYLEWLQTIDLSAWLREAVEDELEDRDRHRRSPPHQNSRSRCPDPALANELLHVGWRALARKYHPDTGGSHEAMLALEGVRAWLETTTRNGHGY